MSAALPQPSTDPAVGRHLNRSETLNLNAEVAEMRTAADRYDVSAPEVSSWTVGMHIQHCCLAMTGVCDALLASEPPPPRARRSLLTAAVFTTGRIPRGRAQSPDQVIPTPGISREELDARLDASAERLSAAADADSRKWFRHFAFGAMDRDRTLRFIQIHNRHHLRIIADILKAADDRVGASSG
jgi:hypothetical protein